MKKTKVRSPLPPLLRLPGQWTKEEAERILYEEIVSRLITVIFIFGAVYLFWFATRVNFTNSMATYFTFFGSIIIFYELYKAYKARANYRHYKLGAEGEVVVGQQLDELRELGYKVLNDFQTGRGNIDHIVIGPAGVFAIETKTMNKLIDKNYDADFYDKHFEHNKEQATYNAKWLKQFFADKIKQDISVQPVLLYPGWFTSVEDLSSDVWVFNPKRFIGHLRKLSPIIDRAEISKIAGYIEHYVRNFKQISN